MCVSFPGRVISVDEGGASVLTEGRVRRASTLLEPDVAVGDWVMVAAGTIVERLDEARAGEIRDALNEALDLMEGDADPGSPELPPPEIPPTEIPPSEPRPQEEPQ
jgi:hydrogenase assembly chaperone HypC/HupF